ncbi:MAG: AI-2E family transporter [Verrucomicrobiota bacterium]
MTKTTRISYAFILATILLVGWLHLATPFLTVLFSYFALEKLRFGQTKTVAIGLFFALAFAVSYLFAFLITQGLEALPHIASTSVPILIHHAQEYGFELPFTDWDSLKVLLLDEIRAQVKLLGTVAKTATKETVLFIIGLVVAVSIFVNSKYQLGRVEHAVKNDLYVALCDEIAARFRDFYDSFVTVMGAQILISTINTGFTSIFVLAIKLPYASLIIMFTFLCGLLPIVGNLLSNTLIVSVALTISPKLAIAALVFLIILHKLEYFLNSKIIGEKIKNPMWLTLLGLILGERLMGIPGMILAPVVLNYIKSEMSKITVHALTETPLPEQTSLRAKKAA